MRTKGQGDRFKRMLLVGCAMTAIVAVAAVTTAGAQDAFPSKQVEIVVPFAPGGSLDIGTRLFAETFAKELKVPVVIKNMAGAGGLTGATAFFNTKPDGYTILAASPAAIISNVMLSKNPSFDPRKDFLPVGYLGASPISMVVGKNSPFKTFNDFLQYAKANPGKLQGGVSSLGGETHIMFMSILKDTKIQSKLIPYTKSADLSMALLGGHLDWKTSSLVSNMPYIKSGDMRPLVLTSKWQDLPNVPTGPEIGLPSASVDVWLGYFVHAKTPKPVYDKLVAAMKNTFKDAGMKDKLFKAGWAASYKDPQEFGKIVSKNWDIFDDILRETGMMEKK
ncbi:MAG: tripartite tricarboxylate transporter substrate binding protein [Deltaproteobacteria bacterium]|nr:tripartite tricarboxylate transporter substrate binding protein [Deltaproteobacteria bacterium]